MEPNENPIDEPITDPDQPDPITDPDQPEPVIDPDQPDPSDPWWMPKFIATVELADGTSLNGSASLNKDIDELWVWLAKGIDFAEAFIVFSDASKTSVIISHTSSIETYTWEGYTVLSLIKMDGSNVTVRMRKPKEPTS